MKKMHFFKAKCRLGLQNKPIGQKDFNYGVEDAPDFILAEDFLWQLASYRISTFVFPKPEDVSQDRFIPELVRQYGDFRRLIERNLGPGETQVVLGGDHSVTFGAITALLARVPNANDIGYIQIDSHPDMNLYSESATKNWHGMYLRPIVDSFDIPEVEALVPKKLAAKNTWFIGNLVMDPGEEKFFKKQNIRNIDRLHLLRDRISFERELKEFVANFKHLHVSFDVDGLDKTVVSATGIPAEDGLRLDDVWPLFDILFKHPNLSFDLVEVNPCKPGAAAAVKLAQDILLMLQNS